MNIGTEYGVGYGYDGYGRLNQITANGSELFTYGYLANSDLVSTITRPNDLQTTFAYEAHRNLLNTVTNEYDGTTVSGYSYTNDAIGRRTVMGRTGSAFSAADTISYTYNDRSEVTGALSNSVSAYDYGYDFDNIGNRLTSRLGAASATYTANNLNQYTGVVTGGNTYTPSYDADGNITGVTLGGSTFSATWNAENRLTVATSSAGKVEFTYDYLGRRVEKKVFQLSSGTFQLVKTERFVYDGFKLIEKLDGGNSNAVLQKFTWSPDDIGGDVPLSVYDASAAATYYYFTDANKNVGQLMDASGNIVAKYEYSPFGEVTAQSGAYADANPFRFSSEYADSETGLVYYNYRYYSPAIGRWLSRDPIAEMGGLNLYGFLDNDGINAWDALGLDGYAVSWPSQGPNTFCIGGLCKSGGLGGGLGDGLGRGGGTMICFNGQCDKIANDVGNGSGSSASAAGVTGDVGSGGTATSGGSGSSVGFGGGAGGGSAGGGSAGGGSAGVNYAGSCSCKVDCQKLKNLIDTAYNDLQDSIRDSRHLGKIVGMLGELKFSLGLADALATFVPWGIGRSAAVRAIKSATAQKASGIARNIVTKQAANKRYGYLNKQLRETWMDGKAEIRIVGQEKAINEVHGSLWEIAVDTDAERGAEKSGDLILDSFSGGGETLKMLSEAAYNHDAGVLATYDQMRQKYKDNCR